MLKPLRRIAQLILVSTLALTMGCDDSRQDEYQNEFDMANHHITSGNYSAAISIMENRLEHDPDDSSARLILASAYAARAGIHMREYFDVITQIIDRVRDAEAFLDSSSFTLFDRLERSAKDSNQKNILAVFEKVYKSIFQINQLINIFSIIPELNKKQKSDLEKAAQILAHEVEFSGGAALYRGLLRLVLLRNNFKSKYDLTHLKKCSINVSRLSQQLSALRVEVVGILNDFYLGSLSTKKSSELMKVTEDVNSGLRDAINYVNTLNATGAISAKDLAQKMGGKCEP